MAVLTINADSTGLSTDRRFRRWGKLITKTDHIDLTKHNGYSLTGPFVDWGKSIALAPGQFLVAAAEAGSRANHGYNYAFLRANSDDQIEVVPQDDIDAAIAEAPDAQRAAALNSPLYAFAVYAKRAMQPGPVSQRMMERVNRAPDSPQVAAARQAIEALTDDERRALFAEFAK